jgi:hypothetical protein
MRFSKSPLPPISLPRRSFCKRGSHHYPSHTFLIFISTGAEISGEADSVWQPDTCTILHLTQVTEHVFALFFLLPFYSISCPNRKLYLTHPYPLFAPAAADSRARLQGGRLGKRRRITF